MSSSQVRMLSGEVGLTGADAPHPLRRLKQAFPAIGWKKAPQGEGRAQFDLGIDPGAVFEPRSGILFGSVQGGEKARGHYLKSKNETARRWLSLADQIARRHFMGA